LASAGENRLDFNRDIRPILSENCFQCHGFDEKARQAELRLDVGDEALADRDGNPVIVAGHPERSELWRRITSDDAAEKMPPPDSHRVLKPWQKDVLKRWIDEGAVYQKHWSFIPPRKPAVPEVHVVASFRDADASVGDTRPRGWPKNEIDHFILDRLNAEGLQPSAEADRRTLVRRVHLDLTGLPPTAAEVEAFAADDSPDAYEGLVDRLLANPHFGERMALVWLDAARYADTNGFSIDGGRHMWLWRDWVINAFNTNLPYDQFVREQLAGDLLPNRTDAQLIATGFQRNNMNTHEGGTIPAENLVTYNVDRVKTLGEAVLGLTLGCAQCHDHKFDPITQRDYYRLFAYFNTLSDVGLDGDAGVNSRPIYEAKTVLKTGEEPGLREQIKTLRSKLENPADEAIARWEEEQRAQLAARGKDFELHPVELLKVSTPNQGAGFDIDPPRFVHITVPGYLIAYDVATRLPQLGRPITGVRVVFHPDQGAPGGGRGYSALPDMNARGRAKSKGKSAMKQAVEGKGTFVLTSFSASSDPVPGDQVNLNRLLGVAKVTADSWLPGYRPEGALDTRNHNGWSPDAATDGPAHLTVTFDEPVDTSVTPFMTVQVNFGRGNKLVAARFEVLAMTGADDGSPLPREIIDILQDTSSSAAPGFAGGSGATGPASAPAGATAGSSSSRPSGETLARRTPEQQQQLRAYFAEHADATKRDQTALANLEERLDVITKEFPTMVMDIAEKPRETFILKRGDYAQPTEKVSASTPAVLPPLPAGVPANRLGLAQWITMREHPLTARVEVNRLWQIFFGTGLVGTPADFGAQGEYPSHPELLDWLAVDFMESGWDVKRMVKKIVMSATYRQSSHVVASLRDANSSLGETRPRDDLLARDPQNRLLARGPRFRLPAEFIRDQALAVSGLLVDRLGGPSVNPYTPGNLWREVSHYGSSPATAQTFEQDQGEKLYRRSLYTYWKRTVPPPNMVAFDAPNREVCTVARASTTTPLQALVLLNDVQFVEAARAFAERAIKHAGDDAERLGWAFQECVSREPTDAESKVLHRALERERARYAADENAARAFLANGESLRDETIPAAEHTAWAQVMALLLNLSETVTRN
jgi:hypothetical protein